MKGDEPTIPSLPTHGPDDTGDAPRWPLVAQHLPAPTPSAKMDLRTVLLGVSMGVNVVLLLVLMAGLVLARAGAFAPSGFTPAAFTSTQESINAGSAGQTESTAWLQVAPTTVHLGCGDGKQTQSVVLTNRGAQQVDWQVDLGGSQDRARVLLSPAHGQLQAGASTTVRVQIHGQGDSQQGVIHFAVTPQSAGSSPSLSYTAQGCD